jgi:ribonuclease R
MHWADSNPSNQGSLRIEKKILMKKIKKESEMSKSFQKLSTLKLKNKLLTFLGEQPKKAFSSKQLIKHLEIGNSRDSVNQALGLLIKSGHVLALPGDRYKTKWVGSEDPNRRNPNYPEGIVDMTRSGAAFVVTEESEQDIYVSSSQRNSALDGDRVRVKVFDDKRGRGRRKEGMILEILERVRKNFIGKLKTKKNFYFVDVDAHEPYPLGFDIFVEEEDLKDSKLGEMVVVEVTEWPNKRRRHAKGKVKANMGLPGSNDYEMKTILVQSGFDLVFPEAVLEEISRLNEVISDEEISRRRDFRDRTTVTIDPLTAKDFDDALSFKALEDGGVEIGVHIADVTHYVQPGSALDKEAYLRSTSVYLVDRVLPMLPEKLSNELCSLRPHEDSLTFSAVFQFNAKMQIVDRWFGKTIIHSDRRFTYEEAQAMIEGQEDDYAEMVVKLNEIARYLRKERFKNGSIAFESDEVQFELDADSKPISIKIKERKEAHLLVEDFMLLANREVASYLQNKQNGSEIPFVYRVHDLPDSDRLENLMLFAKEIGFKFDLQTPERIIHSFNRLASESIQRPELKILEPIAIRTMAKAIYTTQNIGHYGLGFDNYTHFTSPIRRYADVLVHRILEKNLNRPWRMDQTDLERQCKHISAQERKAMDAERQSVSYKQTEYMANFIGEEFEGVISGIIDKGIFVELLATKCEGLVSFDKMQEAYVVAENRLCAVGRNSGHKLKMGQAIRVKIIGVDLEKRNIDMAPASSQ